MKFMFTFSAFSYGCFFKDHRKTVSTNKNNFYSFIRSNTEFRNFFVLPKNILMFYCITWFGNYKIFVFSKTQFKPFLISFQNLYPLKHQKTFGVIWREVAGLKDFRVPSEHNKNSNM